MVLLLCFSFTQHVCKTAVHAAAMSCCEEHWYSSSPMIASCWLWCAAASSKQVWTWQQISIIEIYFKSSSPKYLTTLVKGEFRFPLHYIFKQKQKKILDEIWLFSFKKIVKSTLITYKKVYSGHLWALAMLLGWVLFTQSNTFCFHLYPVFVGGWAKWVLNPPTYRTS